MWAACEIRDGATIPVKMFYLWKMCKGIEPPSRSFANMTVGVPITASNCRFWGHALGFGNCKRLRQRYIFVDDLIARLKWEPTLICDGWDVAIEAGGVWRFEVAVHIWVELFTPKTVVHVVTGTPSVMFAKLRDGGSIPCATSASRTFSSEL